MKSEVNVFDQTAVAGALTCGALLVACLHVVLGDPMRWIGVFVWGSLTLMGMLMMINRWIRRSIPSELNQRPIRRISTEIEDAADTQIFWLRVTELAGYFFWSFMLFNVILLFVWRSA